MKLCMMSCMLGASMTPREIVQTAVECGMDAIDWVSTHKTDPAELRKMSLDAGLKIVSHTMLKTKFLKRESYYMDEFKESLEDACILGSPILMLPPFPRYEQVSMEDDRKAWIEYYAQACPLAQKAGVTLTVESTGYPNSPIVTVEENLEVLKAVPGLMATLDNGNMSTAGDFREGYTRLKEYVVHFHLKDYKVFDTEQPLSSRRRTGKYYRDCVIGEGDLDLRSFWNTVDEKGRELYVNLETLDPAKERTNAQVQKLVAEKLRHW